jgi:IS30 family transposase
MIPNRVDISLRPDIVEDKTRLGDWEIDTIIGARHKGAIVSMVERSLKLTKLVRVPRKTAKLVAAALCKRLKPIEAFVHTLTSDNGKEFSLHETVSAELTAGFYFATPYHSWERGLNEHTNGLVRGYFPKSTNFLEVTQEQVLEVENLLNNRPRKILGFETPLERFTRVSENMLNLEVH